MLERSDRGWIEFIRRRFFCAAVAAWRGKCVSWGARRSPQVKICSVPRTLRNEGPCGEGTALMHFTFASVRLTSRLAGASEGCVVSWGVPR